MREGVIQHHGHFAFLLSETPGEEDVLLKGPTLRLAMDGDRVRARVRPGDRERTVGEISEVVSRARATVTGVLKRAPGGWLAIPEEGAAHDAIRVDGFAPGVRPRDGEIVVVHVLRWPTMQAPASGEARESLGRPGQPGVRLTAVLRTRELPDAFPEDVLGESRRFPDHVTPDLMRGREDLSNLPLFTIDGADAKDFDDAVSLEPAGGLLRLGVHIADVSRYVAPGSALDREAARRATSVYLADRTVPMLPPNLSDHLCSLMPKVERLAVSCFMDITPEGRITSSRLAETVIKSRRRFTYEEVQAVLDGGKVDDLSPEVEASVRRMGALAKRLTRLRLERGALDMNMPEYRVVVDAHGTPLRVEKRPRLDSHRLIEEFMLAANEAVARTLLRAKLEFPHRVHEDPDPKKLEALGGELKKLGLPVPPGLVSHPVRALQQVLRHAEGHPLEESINFMTVRSLKQARYAARPGGHFGLASAAYTHFTSPIRRYPDLLTHRAVKGFLSGDRHVRVTNDPLERVTAHCSERERVATEAERQSVDLLRAALLKRREGQVFEGLVIKNAAFGAFVRLGDTGAEGLLRGAGLTVGSRVTVRLGKVHEGKGELDLELIRQAAPAAPKQTRRSKRR